VNEPRDVTAWVERALLTFICVCAVLLVILISWVGYMWVFQSGGST
jgi:hypothetical protein